MDIQNEKKKNRPLVEQAEEEIIALIKEHHLRPGDKLMTEYELVDYLGVGRGTVREAIRALASRNILEVRQGSGTYLSMKNGVPEDPLGLEWEGLDEQMGLDMIDVRLMLEPAIAAQAAIHADPVHIDALLAQCEKIEACIRAGMPSLEEDARFHQMIAQCTGNRIVHKLIPIIASSIALNLEFTQDELCQHNATLHKWIAQAIAHKDPMGAAAHMTTHLNLLRIELIKKCEESLKSQVSQESSNSQSR